MSFELVTHRPEETMRLGRMLGEMLSGGDFVALVGSLGSGKTVLAKGIAQGLGVEDDREVTSPTFVLVNEYRGRVPVAHVDLYRIAGAAEVESIGWDEFISGPGVTLVEWADKVERELPEERIEVHFQWAGEERRRLRFCGQGLRARQVVLQLEKKWMEGE